MYRLFFQVRINLVVKWYNIYFYYSISVAYDPYIERAVPYMLKWFFPKPKISDCRLLFFSNGCNYASLIWLLHGFKVSKPIENHPLDYTMQKDFFQFPFLIDKPICIRIESLFLTIHLLDRRHYFVSSVRSDWHDLPSVNSCWLWSSTFCVWFVVCLKSLKWESFTS